MLREVAHEIGLQNLGDIWCGSVEGAFVTLSAGATKDLLLVSVVYSELIAGQPLPNREALLNGVREVLADISVDKLTVEDYLIQVSLAPEQTKPVVTRLAAFVQEGRGLSSDYCVLCRQPLVRPKSTGSSADESEREPDEQVLIRTAEGSGLRQVHRRCHEQYELKLRNALRQGRRQMNYDYQARFPFDDPKRSYGKGFLGALLAGLLASLLLIIDKGLFMIVPFIGAFAAHRIYERFNGKWGEKRAAVTATGALIGLIIGLFISGLPTALNSVQEASLTQIWDVLWTNAIYYKEQNWLGILLRLASLSVSFFIFYYLGRLIFFAYYRPPLTYVRFGVPFPVGSNDLTQVLDSRDGED